MGIPPSYGWFIWWKIPLEEDDDWGYPYFRKPPNFSNLAPWHLWLSRQRSRCGITNQHLRAEPWPKYPWFFGPLKSPGSMVRFCWSLWCLRNIHGKNTYIKIPNPSVMIYQYMLYMCGVCIHPNPHANIPNSNVQYLWSSSYSGQRRPVSGGLLVTIHFDSDVPVPAEAIREMGSHRMTMPHESYVNPYESRWIHMEIFPTDKGFGP